MMPRQTDLDPTSKQAKPDCCVQKTAAPAGNMFRMNLGHHTWHCLRHFAGPKRPAQSRVSNYSESLRCN